MTNPVIDALGTQCWSVNGKAHRTDGPAIIYANGTHKWFVNGQRHRTDGPAVIYANGTQRWYVDGVRYDIPKFYQEAANLSDEDMIVVTLKYGVVE